MKRRVMKTILGNKNLYLTGMMGSGKTTVGKILSRWLGVDFIDMDEEIERRCGASVEKIFYEHGEPYFRQLEKKLVREIAGMSPRVVATGGGTLLDPKNREALHRSGALIYLEVDLETLKKRLRSESNRPLLNRYPPLHSLQSIWQQRRHIYESVPVRVVAASDPERVAQLVLFSLPPTSVVLWEGRDKVFLGFNLLPLLVKQLSLKEFADRIFVVSQQNIYDRYGPVFARYVTSGKSLIPILLPEGEKTKDYRYAAEIYKRLIQHHADRRTPVVVMGGGVLGDVTGFAAATFMRGLPLFQLPTTLLSQVDSSLGGKNGINMNGIKNMVGTFYFPKSTYVDLLFLLSLPNREIASGMAEVVKAGFIGDPELVDLVEEFGNEILQKKLPVLYEVVRRSALIKLKIVERDPYERSVRKWLNLGHTFAHGIEGAAGFGYFNHGEAVSLGLILETRLAEALGIAGKGLSRRLIQILSQFQLPTETNGINLKALRERMMMDKKREGTKTVFILPQKIGKVQEIPVENLDGAFRKISLRSK